MGRRLAAASGWVCQFDQLPGTTWLSGRDLSNGLGITCRKIEAPLPGLSYSSSVRFLRLLTRILEFPL